MTLTHQGCPLAFTVAGSGTPVMFINGAGVHGDACLPQIEALRSHYQCITFDNRGMGKSLPAATKISVPQMAEDTLAILDYLSIPKAHLVGHSLGGCVALQIALTAPDRVHSLALLCTSARGADATSLSWPMLKLGIRSKLGTRRMRARAFLEMVLPAAYLATRDNDALAAELAPVFGHDLADSPPIVMHQLRALGRFNAATQLAKLTSIPTLVVSAQHDLIFPPSSGRALAAGIPNARYVEIPDAAHSVPIQLPDQINTLLEQHFSAAKPAA